MSSSRDVVGVPEDASLQRTGSFLRARARRTSQTIPVSIDAVLSTNRAILPPIQRQFLSNAVAGSFRMHRNLAQAWQEAPEPNQQQTHAMDRLDRMLTADTASAGAPEDKQNEGIAGPS